MSCRVVVVDAMCAATKDIDQDRAGLICALRDGHDGPHWDDVDDVSWRPGGPGEFQ